MTNHPDGSKSEDSVGNILLEAALKYAEMGYPVFPLKPERKEPATLHGFKDAVLDPEQIKKWWSENPNYNIGICTDGLIVVDRDGPPGMAWPCDPDQVADLALCGTVQETWSGGMHHVYKQPEGASYGCTRGDIAKGIDTRANGGYIAAAPSRINRDYYPDKVMLPGATGSYQWLEDQELGRRDGLKTPPPWLVEILSRMRKAPNGESSLPVWKHREYSKEEERKILESTPLYTSIYCHELAEKALIEKGWQVQKILSDGEIRFSRPGKNPKDGCSASWKSPRGKSTEWGFPRLAIHSISEDADPFRKLRGKDDPNGDRRTYSAHDILRVYDPQTIHEIDLERYALWEAEGLTEEAYEANGIPSGGGEKGQKIGGRSGKWLNVIRGGEVEPKPHKWLVPKVLPLGILTTLVAEGGTGKTSVVRSIIAHLVKGEGLLSSKDGPAEVLVCLAEDSLDKHFVPAMLAEGCTREQINRLHWVTGVGSPDGSDEEFSANTIPLIEEMLRVHPNIKLVIIDPLASLVANANMKMDSQESARLSSGRLNTLAMKTGISIMQLAHEVKNKEAQGANRIAGSHQYGAASRLVWQLKKVSGGVRLKYLKGAVPRRDCLTLHFELTFLEESECRRLLEKEGYKAEEFEGESESGEAWDAFHYQKVSVVQAPLHGVDLDGIEVEDPVIVKADRKAEIEKQAIARAREAIVSTLEKKGSPIPEATLRNIITGNDPSIKPACVERTISVLLNEEEPKIRRIEPRGNQPAKLCHISVTEFDTKTRKPGKRKKTRESRRKPLD